MQWRHRGGKVPGKESPFLGRCPHNCSSFLERDCQLLQHEVGCPNCSVTHTENCKGKENKQQKCAEMDPPVTAVLVKSIVVVCVGVVVAGFIMASAVQAMKYVKRKAVRRRVGPV
ncbi:hypothetical protein ScPMuIL_017657 [Solemya velum]